MKNLKMFPDPIFPVGEMVYLRFKPIYINSTDWPYKDPITLMGRASINMYGHPITYWDLEAPLPLLGNRGYWELIGWAPLDNFTSIERI